MQYQLDPNTNTANDDDTDTEEVRQLITGAYTAMQKYLEIIPPNEMERAKELMKQPQQEVK